MTTVPAVELTLLGFAIAMTQDTVACPNVPLRTTCNGTGYRPVTGTWPCATSELAAKPIGPLAAAKPTATTCEERAPIRGELVGVTRVKAAQSKGKTWGRKEI